MTGPGMAGLQATKSKADDLADKNVDSTDTELRYAAYGARLRTALRAGHRYLAYVRRLFPHLYACSDNRTPIRLVTSGNLFGHSYPLPLSRLPTEFHGYI